MGVCCCCSAPASSTRCGFTARIVGPEARGPACKSISAYIAAGRTSRKVFGAACGMQCAGVPLNRLASFRTDVTQRELSSVLAAYEMGKTSPQCDTWQVGVRSIGQCKHTFQKSKTHMPLESVADWGFIYIIHGTMVCSEEWHIAKWPELIMVAHLRLAMQKRHARFTMHLLRWVTDLLMLKRFKVFLIDCSHCGYANHMISGLRWQQQASDMRPLLLLGDRSPAPQ